MPPALEEHSQDKVSLLSSTGFWKFLAYQHCSGSSSMFRVGWMSAESSMKLR